MNFKGNKIYVWEEIFAIIKSKKPNQEAFANIVDRNETTVIINQTKVKDEDTIAIEKNWKLITFDMVLDFGLIGFMAKISKALADENISIFAISAYSTDHILVKETDLEKAVKALEGLGFVVNR